MCVSVHFRVVALHPNLLPVMSGSIHIFIKVYCYTTSLHCEVVNAECNIACQIKPTNPTGCLEIIFAGKKYTMPDVIIERYDWRM